MFYLSLRFLGTTTVILGYNYSYIIRYIVFHHTTYIYIFLIIRQSSSYRYNFEG